jgi:hypothetical protein
MEAVSSRFCKAIFLAARECLTNSWRFNKSTPVVVCVASGFDFYESRCNALCALEHTFSRHPNATLFLKHQQQVDQSRIKGVIERKQKVLSCP